MSCQIVRSMLTNRSAHGFLADKSMAVVLVHLSPAVALMWGTNLQTKLQPYCNSHGLNGSKRNVSVRRVSTNVSRMCLSGCSGGRKWMCGECVSTCFNIDPQCRVICHWGCHCPFEIPVWHEGKCIHPYQCPGSYRRNQSIRYTHKTRRRLR